MRKIAKFIIRRALETLMVGVALASIVLFWSGSWEGGVTGVHVVAFYYLLYRFGEV